MSHIASKEFYQYVEEEIWDAKNKGFVLYYEWVMPGSEQDSDDFNKALGIKFDAEIYDHFSLLYGVESQDNNAFLWKVNNLDYNIDLSLSEVMSLYRKKISWKTDPTSSLLASNEIYDISNQVVEQLTELWERELFVLRQINQSILNFIIKHDNLRNFIIDNIGNPDIFTVILDERNKHIVWEILARDDEKIIITYGLMHFSGVLDLLQELDPNWEIISTDYTQVIHQGY